MRGGFKMRSSPYFESFLFISLGIFISTSTFAGGFTQLPRHFGPFEIGMTQSDFRKLTGVTPESCAICIRKESFATLDDVQLEKHDIEGEGGDFFFYDNKLYHIAIGPKDKDLFIAQEDYETQFGPGKTIVNNGIGILKWEDIGTVMTLNYHEREKEVYSFNIYDWNLKEERDWRESIAADESATAGLN